LNISTPKLLGVVEAGRAQADPLSGQHLHVNHAHILHAVVDRVELVD